MVYSHWGEVTLFGQSSPTNNSLFRHLCTEKATHKHCLWAFLFIGKFTNKKFVSVFNSLFANILKSYCGQLFCPIKSF